jgi:hypothetical protein
MRVTLAILDMFADGGVVWLIGGCRLDHPHREFNLTSDFHQLVGNLKVFPKPTPASCMRAASTLVAGNLAPSNVSHRSYPLRAQYSNDRSSFFTGTCVCDTIPDTLFLHAVGLLVTRY